MLIACLQVTGGLILLVFGADRFVSGAAQTARILNISPLVIGLTIVGIATSMPEVLVGSVAAWAGKTNVAIGNAIGSNIANLGLVLGGAAIVKPVLIMSGTLRREYFVMIASSFAALLLMANLQLGRWDALILLITLTGGMAWIIHVARHPSGYAPLAEEIARGLPEAAGIGKSLLIFLIGLLILLAGAKVLVDGAVLIARSFGISDLVIGLTVIAVGTSLPELATSVAGILKDEGDIAIGNIIGSNIFNMTAVLAIPVLIHPDTFVAAVLYRDFSVMIALSVFMGWLILKPGRQQFGRLEGALMLLCFIGYQASLFVIMSD